MTQEKSSKILEDVKTFITGKTSNKEQKEEGSKNKYVSESSLEKKNKTQSTIIKSLIDDSISKEGMQKLIDNFKLNPVESLYGRGHWGRVINNGLKLSALIDNDNVSEKVIILFGLLHDVKRNNEDNYDLNHGYRASKFIKNEMLPYLNITEKELDDLCNACSIHDRKEKSDNPTVAICLDANLLDLPRKGIDVEPSFLNFLSESTAIQEEAEINAMEQKTPSFIIKVTKNSINENIKRNETQYVKRKKPA